ncbi:MAG: M20 family metallo-hydrolase [Mangrovibacterium sp.]
MKEYINLLCQLIETPSLSRSEHEAAQVLRQFIRKKGVEYEVVEQNTILRNRHWNEKKPTLLLNSHIDTVKPAENWSYQPFNATCEGDKITGLGSNDAGASVVTLLAVFFHFYAEENLPYNLMYIASAEEEVSGKNGMESLIAQIGDIELAIVGEPTQMHLAVAEKGLMVLDCQSYGKSGHAARNEGENAIYNAIEAIHILRNYQFEKTSDFLGAVKMSITQINAGYQHNVVPDVCNFVVDVRTNEMYSNHEVLEIIQALVSCDVNARSTRLNSSSIARNHPLVLRGIDLGRELYGSPTLSDQALMPFASVKIGPGDSARSHTADEYILISEMEEALALYIQLLDGLTISV